jgi:16S rRNA (guanine527-N7)-methyltransferase
MEVFEQFNVSRESRKNLETYVSMLTNWQRTISLVGSSTLEEVWNRHIADSLQLIRWLPLTTQSIADLGTGAGFPGLVLAIATGHLVHLYESNGKKAAFLRQVIAATRANAQIHQNRIELLGDDSPAPPVQVVVARALAPLTRLLVLAEPFFRIGAIGLFHKGQDVDAELTEAAKYWKLDCTKHSSLVDSSGVILEVREAYRVKCSTCHR